MSKVKDDMSEQKERCVIVNTTNTEQHESGMFYNKMKDRQHLYALTREDLATVENELLQLARNSKLSLGQRKAVVSASASMITLIDIVNMLGEGEGNLSGGSGVNGCLSSPDHSPKISQKICDTCKYFSRASHIGYMHTCLLDPVDYIITCTNNSCDNWSEKFPENSENVSKKLIDMLQFLASVTLTEEEWLDSYDLYVKHRASPKNRKSTPQRKQS